MIALDTRRDSTGMMAISVVTMFFLPGTFTSLCTFPSSLALASFFALPIFDSAEGTPSFWVLYWATTILLTPATVLLTYRLWVWYKRPPGKLFNEKKKAKSTSFTAKQPLQRQTTRPSAKRNTVVDCKTVEAKLHSSNG
ncbi:hypothetical protein GE09DRAFT_1210021 [Coniochaeta sp. 2T2.1]|nr:hypothetical protein GE09DRAFT_1210021 [Coniochaeta sp. 2T2.1]